MRDIETVVSDNIKKLLEEKNLNQNELAKIAGVSESTVGKWVLKKSFPRMGAIEKIANYFDLPKSYILNESKPINLIEATQKMPLIDGYAYFPTAAISAGHPSTVEGVTQAEKISIADKIMGKYAGDKDVFITRINGDSMDKVIPDSSLIAVKPVTIDSLKDGDIVVFSNDHDYSVKYYYKHGDKIIFKPHSNNLRHHEQHYDLDDDITIHGKVVTYIVNLD